MDRTVCPQLKGIYKNDFLFGKTEYDCIYIPVDRPDEELGSIWAYECNVSGTVNPGKTFSTVFQASEIGAFVKAI